MSEPGTYSRFKEDIDYLLFAHFEDRKIDKIMLMFAIEINDFYRAGFKKEDVVVYIRDEVTRVKVQWR